MQAAQGVAQPTGARHDPGKETARIELAAQQRQEPSEPARVVIDPQTRKEHVLVRREVYARMRAIFDEEGPDMRAVGALVDRVMREEEESDPTPAFHRDGGRLAWAREDATVCLWIVKTGPEALSLQGDAHFSFMLAFSPNGDGKSGVNSGKLEGQTQAVGPRRELSRPGRPCTMPEEVTRS